MNNSQQDKNHLHGDELGKIISLHLDAQLTDEQFHQLQHTLEVDESARDFYIEFMSSHARLEQTLTNTFSIKGQEHLSDKEILNQLPIVILPQSKLPLLGMSVAFIVVICVFIGIWYQPDYATISSAHQAKINGSEQLSVGNRVKSHESYILESGHVELLFSSGSKVLITAPSTFEVSGNNELNLSQGKLVAKVTTASGKGFTVNTPAGAVVDLGTLFGVDVEASGDSRVQVFQGEVKLNNASGTETSLLAGKTMRCEAGAKKWQPAKTLSREFYSSIQEKKQTFLPDMVFIDDANHNVFGMDRYVGVRYLMYSAVPLKDRFATPENDPRHWEGVTPHFVIVHFEKTSKSWHLQGNEHSIQFKPDSTDLLIARIEENNKEKNSKKKKVTYFSESYETIHGIACGYQASDIKVLPDWFQKLENRGDYSISGTYFIRKSE